MRTYGFTQALRRHPEVTDRPVSVDSLRERFRPRPATSARALLIQMGPFVAATDAFRFTNGFPITGEVAARYAAFVGEELIEQVARAALPGYLEVLTDLRIPNPIPGLPDLTLPDFVIDLVMNRTLARLVGGLVDLGLDPVGSNYGRCGGMAFAAYDLYLRGRPVDPRTTIPPEDSPLDEYLLDRLLDSLDLNVRTFLDWLMVLHVMPKVGEFATAALLDAVSAPLGTALRLFVGSRLDIFGLGGADVLLSRTRQQWRTLTRRLDEQAAWPVGVVFGARKNPFDQHQVLAVGYDDPGNGTAELTIWDNNHGNREHVLRIDFRGDGLKVRNYDGDVKGIIAERYEARVPPANV